MNKNWSGIVLGIIFFRFGHFFWICFSACFPWYLQHFGAGNCHFNCLCNMLELEHIINHRFCNNLVEYVTFWSWKLPFQGYLQHFRVRTSCSMDFATFWCWNCSCYMVVCNYVSFRVGFRVSLGVLFGLKLFKGWI